jgi:hypothetical protein
MALALMNSIGRNFFYIFLLTPPRGGVAAALLLSGNGCRPESGFGLVSAVALSLFLGPVTNYGTLASKKLASGQ